MRARSSRKGIERKIIFTPQNTREGYMKRATMGRGNILVIGVFK